MQNVSRVFFHYLRQCQTLLTEKIVEISSKIAKVNSDIKLVRNENYLKSESSSR